MVKYPELAKIMAVTGTTKRALANIIGKAPAAATQKMAGKTDFKLAETAAITKYFREQAEINSDLVKYYPIITSDIIFYESVHNSEQDT